MFRRIRQKTSVGGKAAHIGPAAREAGAARAGPSMPNPWRAFPERVCDQCGQGTHAPDRDSNPDAPQWLMWHKTRQNSKGEVYPCGQECYKCFDTRRRYFPEMSKDELRQARNKIRAVDDRFTELREDRVRGDGRFKKDEGVDVQALVQKKQAQYDESYVEAHSTRWTPMPGRSAWPVWQRSH